jgi:Cu-Zn family superoxide dismutase
MMTLRFSLPVLAVGLLLMSSGCGESAKTATATLESKSGSTVTGTVTFTQDGSKVNLKLEAAGLTPGTHAVHLHDVGDCSAADATSAGSHWNPSQMMHGNSATGAPMARPRSASPAPSGPSATA